ncbi:two-component system response regulator BasR [Salinivibrio sp. IB574]|uniref:response regulator n=1 Tax=Salinivibrio sp. IB574 TaxID=1909444 RepID=UPI0009899DA1|nr:response regulator [Salinivibrio sp. IB574]OOF23649.1 two-component system response regulator BasR [Salinivibrio sp. IB574]
MRLLLVEDDCMLGESMVASLQRHGYTVDWLQRGGGVDALLNTESFTAIILDLTLPDTDGLHVLRKIRRKHSDIPVMILTARDDIDDRVKGLDGGADDYMIKPFALEELLARLRVMIRRISGYADTTMSCHGVTLSMATGEVDMGGAPIRLTPNEFKLLSTLMAHAGRVMSKDQLQQALHGMDEGISPNAIEVHIHNLRKKTGGTLIQNIRGVGYIIEK